MSRIAFFAETFSHEDSIEGLLNQRLVESLLQNQHEVQVFTDFNNSEELSLNPKIQVLRPFKKWNFFECFKLLPHLMQNPPDVIHFVQSTKSNKWIKVFRYISSVVKIQFNPVIALTYFNVEPDILGAPLKYHHLQFCDLILVPNNLQQQMVTVVPSLPSHQIVEVMSPTTLDSFHPTESSWVSEELSHIIFVPGPVSSHEKLSELLAGAKHLKPDTHLVFADGYGSLSKIDKSQLQKEIHSLGLQQQVLILDELSLPQRQGIYKKAKWVLMSSLNAAGFHVSYELHRSLSLGKPVVINASQAAFDHFKWQDGENCLFCESNRSDYSELFSEKVEDTQTQKSIESAIHSLDNRALMDDPGNRLSRLYLNARSL